MKRKLMKAGWEEYMAHVYPDGACEECMKQTKQAFFAGALVMYIGMDVLATSMPSPLAEAAVKGLLTEVNNELHDNFSTTVKPNE